MKHHESLLSSDKLDQLAQLARNTPNGPLIEVGVYCGGSAEVLYEIAMTEGRALYLYDTFTGIPFACEDDSHKVGDFAEGLTLDQAREVFPGAIVQDGIFPRSQAIPARIAFVHLDCDQYQSYRESLDKLVPLMMSGGVILCDDYCLKGAAKAIDETQGDKRPLADGRIYFQF